MKRIWIFLMAMLSIVSFTGCDKTDEPNVLGTDYANLLDKTYTHLHLHLHLQRSKLAKNTHTI